jgi:uncharacterized protein YlxW (UPF0749 family)
LNREKLRANIWIGIGSIILGLIISFQLKVVSDKFLNGMTPTKRSAQLIQELENTKNQNEIYAEEIARLEAELADIKDSAADESVIIKNLNDKIELYKKFAGLTEVSGPGILIVVDNSNDSMDNSNQNLVYDYNLILSLVNELNAAGAEAISINEQRIVSYSEIRTAGNYLKVNSIPLSPPFNIKAIGNPDTLHGSINQRFGIVSIIRDNGYFIENTRKSDIQITKYDGVIEFNYLEDVVNE